MTYARLVGTAIAFMIISFVVSSAGAYADMSHYTNPDYFPVWSKLMMPAAGPPTTEFFAYSLIFSFITGLIFCFVYLKISQILKYKTLKKGAIYGIGFFLVSTIPGSLSLILIINLPVTLIISWAVQGLIASTLSGIVAAKIIR